MPKQVIEQEKNWYVIHTYSGYEDAVAKNLKQRIEFLGAGTTPISVSKKDIDDLMKRMEVGEPEFKIDFELGASVKITDGPFKGFEGKVSEIDPARGKIKVLVNMFGRDTPVELDSLQIKKLQ